MVFANGEAGEALFRAEPKFLAVFLADVDDRAGSVTAGTVQFLQTIFWLDCPWTVVNDSGAGEQRSPCDSFDSSSSS